MEQPPARYSTDQVGCSHDIGSRIRARLDSVERQDVVEYDCESGVVLRNVVDKAGNVMLNDAKDAVRQEAVTGIVTVEWVG